MVASLVDKLKRAKALVFTNFAGLKVLEVTELRKRCRQEHVEYLVAKKTLLAKACEQVKLTVDSASLPGEVALAFGFGDEVAPARILVGFAKDHPTLKPFGGVLEQALVSREKILALASLPSKAELLAQAVRSLAAPLSGMVNVLAGNLRGLVQVLKSMSEKKPAQAG